MILKHENFTFKKGFCEAMKISHFLISTENLIPKNAFVFSSRKRGEADRRCDETAQGTQPMQKM
jgi:hypothetical protein